MPNDSNDLSEAQARRLENVSAQLTSLLRERDAERRRAAKTQEDWSAMQVLGHTVEMIPYWLDQIRAIIAAPEPPTFGRSQDSPERLAGPEHGATGDLEDLLGQLHTAVETAAHTIRTLTPEERAKKGTHIRRGEMTVGDMLEFFIVAHSEEHLAQIQAS